jgi:hypothetical protein
MFATKNVLGLRLYMAHAWHVTSFMAEVSGLVVATPY